MKEFTEPLNVYMGKSLGVSSRLTWDEFRELMEKNFNCRYDREKKQFVWLYDGKWKPYKKDVIVRFAAIFGYFDDMGDKLNDC
ncbi:MAG TPA: hypothetical protein PK659_07485 [Methanothrix sp.]|nr:hypothetical protein [Methanothrix sp.]HOL44074.1 hypothetical protein [Methanothrix sp.]